MNEKHIDYMMISIASLRSHMSSLREKYMLRANVKTPKSDSLLEFLYKYAACGSTMRASFI